MSPPSLHSAVFYPDAEQAITTGVTAMSVAALDLFSNKATQGGTKPE